MSKIALRGLAALAGAALTLTAGAATAQADTKSFSDPAPHLTKVTVKHGSKNVKITVKTGHYRAGSYFTLYVDTDPSNPGPEYRNVLYPNSELLPLKRVDSFGDPGSTKTCDGLRGRADVYGPEEVTLVIPRSCMGNPDKVRVSVRGYFDVKGPNEVDWAPGKKKFTGWVAR